MDPQHGDPLTKHMYRTLLDPTAYLLHTILSRRLFIRYHTSFFLSLALHIFSRSTQSVHKLQVAVVCHFSKLLAGRSTHLPCASSTFPAVMAQNNMNSLTTLIKRCVHHFYTSTPYSVHHERAKESNNWPSSNGREETKWSADYDDTQTRSCDLQT